ncbi:MAG: hypothetical protein JOZ17_19040, partial [Acetobacteraceae bacterium]|nr:hypothetical protein [Acetobacteraceae bacterium]
EEVESILLHRLPAVCIMPRGHRLAAKRTILAADLAGERFVSLGRQDQSRLLIDKIFDDLQVPRRMQIETGQSEVAFALVASGAGVSVIDPLTVFDQRDDRIEVRPFKPPMTFSVWLIVPRQQRPMMLLEDFTAHMKSELTRFVQRLERESAAPGRERPS